MLPLVRGMTTMECQIDIPVTEPKAERWRRPRGIGRDVWVWHKCEVPPDPEIVCLSG
jgi:hypothetical protein